MLYEVITSAEKNANNLTDNQLIVCWPKVSLEGVKFWLSTQLACLICQTDASNNDIPYVSPSNKSLQMDSAVANGVEVWLGPDSTRITSYNVCYTKLLRL